MKDYTTDSRVFHNSVSLVERADLINNDNKNAAIKQLVENDLVLKARMEQCFGDKPEYGDSKELKITFDSGDAASANAWTDVAVIKSGETHKSLFDKISTMFKNVRYLYKLLGSTDISQVGNGTVTGAIKNINTEVGKKVNFTDISQSAAVTVAGQKALDAIEKNASIEGTLANELGKINSNFINFTQKYFDGYVGNTFSLVPGMSEILIYVFVGGNSEICLIAHWCSCMVNWYNDRNRAIRLLGKSKAGGVEYGAILGINNTNIWLSDAWIGTENVTSNTVVCFAYR